MECPRCGRVVGPDDRFCNGCGTALAVTEPPTPTADPVDTVGPVTADLPITEPVPARPEPAVAAAVRTDELPATEPVPATGPTTDDLPSTEPITEVWMGTVQTGSDDTPAAFDAIPAAGATTQMPSPSSATATMPIVPIVGTTTEPPRGFRFSLLLFISLATGVLSLVALFANVVTISSDTRLIARDGTPDDFRTGTWIVDDLADNLSIGGLIAIALMVAGGLASGFRWRWGSGLAGGAGLAMAGLSALTIGLAQFPIDSARAFARVPSDDPFVLTVTRDLGYWLLIGAGALGIVLFFASVNDAFGDRRPGLNPWIAALGGLAVVVTAAGPLIPENQAVPSDNWYIIVGPGEAPAMLLVGRLVQIGLFLIGGVIGFLSVRRWGLGLAIGVSLTVIWLVVSTLFEFTDDPVGLGYRNQGAVDMHVHGVTIIGTSGLVAMIVLALVAAYDQGHRERR